MMQKKRHLLPSVEQIVAQQDWKELDNVLMGIRRGWSMGSNKPLPPQSEVTFTYFSIC